MRPGCRRMSDPCDVDPATFGVRPDPLDGHHEKVVPDRLQGGVIATRVIPRLIFVVDAERRSYESQKQTCDVIVVQLLNEAVEIEACSRGGHGLRKAYTGVGPNPFHSHLVTGSFGQVFNDHFTKVEPGRLSIFCLGFDNRQSKACRLNVAQSFGTSVVAGKFEVVVVAIGPF